MTNAECVGTGLPLSQIQVAENRVIVPPQGRGDSQLASRSQKLIRVMSPNDPTALVPATPLQSNLPRWGAVLATYSCDLCSLQVQDVVVCAFCQVAGHAVCIQPQLLEPILRAGGGRRRRRQVEGNRRPGDKRRGSSRRMGLGRGGKNLNKIGKKDDGRRAEY